MKQKRPYRVHNWASIKRRTKNKAKFRGSIFYDRISQTHLSLDPENMQSPDYWLTFTDPLACRAMLTFLEKTLDQMYTTVMDRNLFAFTLGIYDP